jgi:hypothetical protein
MGGVPSTSHKIPGKNPKRQSFKTQKGPRACCAPLFFEIWTFGFWSFLKQEHSPCALQVA